MAEGITQAVTYLPDKLTSGLAKIVRVQSIGAAEEQLRKEPMFCMETGEGEGALPFCGLCGILCGILLAVGRCWCLGGAGLLKQCAVG